METFYSLRQLVADTTENLFLLGYQSKCSQCRCFIHINAYICSMIVVDRDNDFVALCYCQNITFIP